MALILASSLGIHPLASTSRNPPPPARSTRKPSKPFRCPPHHPSGHSAPQTLKCSSQESQSTEQFERLFSNLNQSTMKHEPGSLISAIFLVAGTTVGAGILAIPAVTQEAGFLPSARACMLCWIYMVVTGLLIAEVNVNTICELGSGGISLVSMARRTLGNVGIQAILNLSVLSACLAHQDSFAM